MPEDAGIEADIMLQSLMDEINTAEEELKNLRYRSIYVNFNQLEVLFSFYLSCFLIPPGSVAYYMFFILPLKSWRRID